MGNNQATTPVLNKNATVPSQLTSAYQKSQADQALFNLRNEAGVSQIGAANPSDFAQTFGKDKFCVPDMKKTQVYDKLNHWYKFVLELGDNRRLIHDWGKYTPIHQWLRKISYIKEYEKEDRKIPFQIFTDDETIDKKKKELLLTKLVME